MFHHARKVAATVAASAMVTSTALAGELVINTDTSEPAPMAAFEALIAGFFIENHAAYSWQEALAPMVQGEAAMYVMGNFAVAPLREAGLSDDQLGFFQFPVINPDVPLAEEAPTDTVHIPANATNKEDARKFLAYLARADVQTEVNATLGQLPINKDSEVGDDKFLQAGYNMLSSTTGGIAQFFDRDAPAEMAKAGMEGFQEFMVKPERLDAILERLDREDAQQGELSFALAWDSRSDLDLHVTCPAGRKINWENRSVNLPGCAGNLDVDANGSGGRLRRDPVENIYFTEADNGEYVILVDLHEARDGASRERFIVLVRDGGETRQLTGSVSESNDWTHVYRRQ